MLAFVPWPSQAGIDKPLEDGRTLSDYIPLKPITIIIDIIKDRFQDKEDIPPDINIVYMEDIVPDQGRLTSLGNHLEDGRTLLDHNVLKEYTLHLMLRLCEGMQIFVRNFAGKAPPLDDEASDMLDTVEDTAQDKEGIRPAHRCLIFVGRQLEDSNTFSEHDIQKETPLHMVLRLHANMQIIVKLLVGYVKAKIQDKKGIPPTLQRLIFADKQFDEDNEDISPDIPPDHLCLISADKQLEFGREQLKDDRNPSEHGIQKESTIHLVLYDIQKEPTLPLVPRIRGSRPIIVKTLLGMETIADGSMPVFVKTLTGKEITFLGKQLKYDRTLSAHLVLRMRASMQIIMKLWIGHVRAKIQDKKGIPPTLQRLTAADKQLEEDRIGI